MKILASLIFLSSSAVMAAEKTLVVGQVIDPDSPRVSVRVCGSEQIVELGVMASNQYHGLMKRVHEASKSGPVLIQVRGEWNGETLESMSTQEQLSGHPRLSDQLTPLSVFVY